MPARMIGAAIVAAVTLAACGGGTSSDTTSGQLPDPLSISACERWNSVLDDETVDITPTNPTVVEAVSYIYSNTRQSSDPELTAGATEMNSAVSSDDDAAFTHGVWRFQLACSNDGVPNTGR